MDAPNSGGYRDSESRTFFCKLITPQLKSFLGKRMLLDYATRKQWKKGRRLQFDMDLYRAYLFDACREAECENLLPGNTRLEVAIILGSDEEFYRELFVRSESL